jgi:predicted Zn-dependent protease
VKVKQKRYDEMDVEGYLEIEKNGSVEVDGKPVVWPQGAAVPELKSGMQLKGKGTVLDDGTIQIKSAALRPPGFDEDQSKFMGLVSQEVHDMKEKLPYLDDPELQAYVARMGKSLVPSWVSPEQFQFTFSVIDDTSLNAFAMPDGTVVIHTGLLAALENEAQFATVIGHEIAHATHLHGYRGYKNQGKMKWLQLGAIAGGIFVGAKTDSALAGILTGVGSSLTINAIVNGHGRNLEDDADRIGLQYMVDAGYDYMQAPAVWKVFSKHTKDQGSVANFFFSDHSTHRARISNLTREINARYRSTVDRSRLETNEEAYQRATAKLKARARAAKEP